MTWSKVCAANIAVGECKGVQIADVDLAIFNVAGRYYATSNICTHQFALLSEGYLEDDIIECPLHQARFNVETGTVVDGPADEGLKVFPIQIERGEVYVNLEPGA